MLGYIEKWPDKRSACINPPPLESLEVKRVGVDQFPLIELSLTFHAAL